MIFRLLALLNQLSRKALVASISMVSSKGTFVNKEVTPSDTKRSSSLKSSFPFMQKSLFDLMPVIFKLRIVHYSLTLIMGSCLTPKRRILTECKNGRPQIILLSLC